MLIKYDKTVGITNNCVVHCSILTLNIYSRYYANKCLELLKMRQIMQVEFLYLFYFNCGHR